MAAADPSEPFAQACRARLSGVEVVVAGAEAGVREMARVTRPAVASCALHDAYRREFVPAAAGLG